MLSAGAFFVTAAGAIAVNAVCAQVGSILCHCSADICYDWSQLSQNQVTVLAEWLLLIVVSFGTIESQQSLADKAFATHISGIQPVQF